MTLGATRWKKAYPNASALRDQTTNAIEVGTARTEISDKEPFEVCEPWVILLGGPQLRVSTSLPIVGMTRDFANRLDLGSFIGLDHPPRGDGSDVY
jgi:hypothetical protein